MPADAPVTMPEVPTAAVPALLHVPPGAASDKAVVALTQTTGVPAMVPAAGNGFTVIMNVA